MNVINAGNRIMNTYVYEIDDGFVMIDTGYENSFKSVKRKLSRHNIDLSDIKYVFLTHAHDDHARFLNELLIKYPHIKVIADKEALPVLIKGQNSFEGGCSSKIALAFCKIMSLLGKGEHKFPAISDSSLDRFIFIDNSNINQLEKLLNGKILFTPGHTADSVSLKIGHAVFCGDAAMNGLPSLKRITIWVEDKDDFYNSWNVLLSTDIRTVVPAHGRPFKIIDLRKYQKGIANMSHIMLTDAGFVYKCMFKTERQNREMCAKEREQLKNELLSWIRSVW